MRRRSSFTLPWAPPCALAVLLHSPLAAAQPLEPGASGQPPDAQGGAPSSDGVAAADTDRAAAPVAEPPPPPAAAGNEVGARDEAAPPAADGPENEVGAPLAPAYEPPPPSPPREARRRAGGGAGFGDGDEFGVVYFGGGYPWGVSEGKGGNRFEGRGSFTLGAQGTFGQIKGWGVAIGLEFSMLFTQNVVGDSEVPVQFVESAILPIGVYVRAGNGVLLELEGLVGVGGMRFENIGKMELVGVVGGRLGALIALKALSASTFFVNPRVDFLVHPTENLGAAQFIVPTLNLGFQFQ